MLIPADGRFTTEGVLKRASCLNEKISYTEASGFFRAAT